MAKYIRLAILAIFVLLVGGLYQQYSLKKKYFNEYQRAESNFKASQHNLDSVTTDNRAYQLNISEMAYSKDSVIRKLREAQESLKIKDKNLISMSYLKSTASKSDTIRIPGDTIFKGPQVNIDTTLTDKWYTLNVKLQCPSSVIVNPRFISEKYIIASYKKETIAPPKKWWLLRLFQKKHKVVTVEVVEKNPYIQSNNNKFIEVVK